MPTVGKNGTLYSLPWSCRRAHQLSYRYHGHICQWKDVQYESWHKFATKQVVTLLLPPTTLLHLFMLLSVICKYEHLQRSPPSLVPSGVVTLIEFLSRFVVIPCTIFVRAMTRHHMHRLVRRRTLPSRYTCTRSRPMKASTQLSARFVDGRFGCYLEVRCMRHFLSHHRS